MLDTLFGWVLGAKNNDSEAKPTPVAFAILDMMRNKCEERDVLAAVDALTLEQLDEPLVSSRETHQAPLLRFVREWMSTNSEQRSSYPKLEAHLVEKGVKQDIIYHWIAKDVSLLGEDALAYPEEGQAEVLYKPSPSVITLSINAMVAEYMRWIYNQNQLGLPTKMNERACKRLINEMSVEELNKPIRKIKDITLLHLAASLGDVGLTLHLLQKGANPNAKAKSVMNMTPLLYALASSSDKDNFAISNAVGLLLSHHANSYAKTESNGAVKFMHSQAYSDGETALDICAKCNNIEVAILLVTQYNHSVSDVKHDASEEFARRTCDQNQVSYGVGIPNCQVM